MSVAPLKGPPKDHVYESDAATGSVINWVVAISLLAFGIGTILWTINLVIRCYSPAWAMDQWSMASLLADTHGHPGLHALWAQHNEHRIVLQRLLGLADMFWFGNRAISLQTETIAVQLLHLGLLIYACRRWGNFLLSTLVGLSGFLAYCFFSPLQRENFLSGFQVTFVLVALTASATIFTMLVCAQQMDTRRRDVYFGLAIAGAAVTEMGNANGLLIWPILLFMAFVLQIERRKQLLLLVFSGLGIFLYLRHYHSPPYHSNPLQTIRQPGKMCKYILTSLSDSWDANVPNPSPWPTVAESLSFVAMVALVVLVARFLLRCKCETPILTFLVADALFFLGTIALASMGRMKFGYVQATASRYQSFALGFWACVAVGTAVFVSSRAWRPRAVLQSVLLIAVIAALGRWPLFKVYELDRKAGLDRGWNAMLAGDFNNPAITYLYPDPNFVRAMYPVLVSYHLIPDKTRH